MRRLSSLPSSGNSPISVAAVTGPTPGTDWTRASLAASSGVAWSLERLVELGVERSDLSLAEAVVKRAVKPCMTAWWARFCASMILPTPLGPEDDVDVVAHELQLEEVIDQVRGLPPRMTPPPPPRSLILPVVDPLAAPPCLRRTGIRTVAPIIITLVADPPQLLAVPASKQSTRRLLVIVDDPSGRYPLASRSVLGQTPRSCPFDLVVVDL